MNTADACFPASCVAILSVLWWWYFIPEILLISCKLYFCGDFGVALSQ